MSDLTDFGALIDNMPMPTVWQTSFEVAHDELRDLHPDGFNPKLIGRQAWDALPVRDRDKALGELFHTYWAAVDREEAELARWEQEKAPRRELHLLLSRFEELAKSSRAVPYALLADIARLSLELMGGTS